VSGKAPEPGAPSEPVGGGATAPSRPPATLSLLVASLAAQVQVSMGLVANPITGKTERDLAAAKHGIDLLDVLQAKTKGNLDEREAALLSHVLYDLRLAYVQAMRAAK
jgi:hypothetical protein